MRGQNDGQGKPERNQRVWTVAAGLLVLGAICVGALAFRALPSPKPDLREPVAALAIARAAGAAESVSQRVSSVRLMLEALAEKGGAKPGRTRATRFAMNALKRVDGLEQLAAYGANGKTRWVMRPAKNGSMKFPRSKAFLTAHLERADLEARIGAPFKPRGVKGWWIPVSHIVRNKEDQVVAVLVAFMNQKMFPPLLQNTGDATALLTGSGALVTGTPESEAPIGASFSEAPGFAAILGNSLKNGVYEGQDISLADGAVRMIGFAKLACCDAIVTTATDIPMPAPPAESAIAPAVHWLTLSAAGLMIFLALGLISHRMFYRQPDPWLDFGDKPQPTA